jgi:hypothetical protein
MTALNEALHCTSKDVEEVCNMNTNSYEFTHFVTMVCQSFMRSAHVCPYVFDKVLSADLDSAGQLNQKLSESFKLPFRLPFFGLSNTATFLNADDCEGQATFMLYLLTSFQHMYEKYGCKPFKYHKMFPSHLFKIGDKDKLKLWNLGLKIGKQVSVGALRCDIILIAAGSAALGDGGNQLGGHATCVLVNASNPSTPFDILMEGTNSMMWDEDARLITLKLPDAKKDISLVETANLLTTQIANLNGEMDKVNGRILIHLNKSLESKFYKTAFCQNGTLLASNNSLSEKLEYGINMMNISDYEQKVLMPISPNLIDSLSQQSNATEFLHNHCKQRKEEIHPPRVDLHTILDATKPWTPMTMFQQSPTLKGRTFKTCLSMLSIRNPQERLEYASNLEKQLCIWNKKYKDIGFCSSYVAFDTVFTKLCFWTDNLLALENALTNAMCEKIQNIQVTLVKR